MIDDELPYWDHTTETLHGSQYTKAKRFLREGCVRQVGPHDYLVLPIRGYNTTIHHVKHTIFGWKCDCQYWNKYQGERICSHILAVLLYLEEKGI